MLLPPIHSGRHPSMTINAQAVVPYTCSIRCLLVFVRQSEMQGEMVWGDRGDVEIDRDRSCGATNDLPSSRDCVSG